MILSRWAGVVLGLSLAGARVSAEVPAVALPGGAADTLASPPAGGFLFFTAADVPYDAGGRIALRWGLGAEPQDGEVVRVFRRETGGEWSLVGEYPAAAGEAVDSGARDRTPYDYVARLVSAGGEAESAVAAGVTSHPAWFNMAKINLLVIALVVMTVVVWYVLRADRRGPMFIRRIAGLQAVDEAVGRATEMGRSVVFVPGIQDLDDVQTIAGLTILGSVARTTARYETKLDVPVARSLVMSNGREVVRQAYLAAGRPDFYHDDIVHYVTDEQFGYVAAVDGIMVREKPAACFYMGAFFAESLILAETGNSVGAIQIAGTAMPTQLPFFVAACDYTLIGEELFAASAYLSQDQRMIASLRGQDLGKLLAMVSIALGTALATAAELSGGQGVWARLSDAFIRLFALNY